MTEHVSPSEEATTYVMYAVFRYLGGLTERPSAVAEVDELLSQLADKGVVTRGTYAISGFRPNADLMFWWLAPTSDDLQEAYLRFRRTGLGRVCEPVWSVIGIHREAEFNKAHVPAFLEGKPAQAYAAVYPYNRTNGWYLLEPSDRGGMLAEHGLMGREYSDVQANTVSGFALGDYEFVIALEAAHLHRIVDLMRYLRGARAREHTRLETPFFTGPRRPIADIVAALP